MGLVIVTDSTFSPLDIEISVFKGEGLSLESYQCRSAAELRPLVRDADYILTQFAPVDASVIDAMERVQVIVRYGIGVDNVDVNAARDKRIPVCNVPDYCIDEVADHALALMLAGTRQVVANADLCRQGRWELAVPVASMRTLRAMTVGLVGFGRIGRAVAARLRPFGCDVQIFDPGVDSDQIKSAGCRPVPLDELWSTSDVVSLHCPANQATHHLIDAEAISQMKQGVILVNVARGAVVCTESLVEGLRSGRIGFAALDVLETEPMPAGHPLQNMENAIVHSHVASVSLASSTKLRRDAASIVACAARGEPLPNVVNGVGVKPNPRKTESAPKAPSV